MSTLVEVMQKNGGLFSVTHAVYMG